MNRLECQVTSCQHYCDNLCCLPGIQVDGPAARESSQTCCDSYEERRQGSGQNSTDHVPSVDSSIVCVGCCCGDVCSKGGTECCTFQPE